jgi:hypothetical protein
MIIPDISGYIQWFRKESSHILAIQMAITCGVPAKTGKLTFVEESSPSKLFSMACTSSKQ